MAHKHRWEPATVVTHTNPVQVNVVWRCAVRNCRSFRSVQLQVRRPRADALTDAERAERDQARATSAREKLKRPWRTSGDFLDDLDAQNE